MFLSLVSLRAIALNENVSGVKNFVTKTFIIECYYIINGLSETLHQCLQYSTVFLIIPLAAEIMQLVV